MKPTVKPKASQQTSLLINRLFAAALTFLLSLPLYGQMYSQGERQENPTAAPKGTETPLELPAQSPSGEPPREAGKPANMPAETPAQNPSGEPPREAAKPANMPADTPGQSPSGEPPREAGKPANIPAETPAQSPSGEPPRDAGKPANIPAETPAKTPADLPKKSGEIRQGADQKSDKNSGRAEGSTSDTPTEDPNIGDKKRASETPFPLEPLPFLLIDCGKAGAALEKSCYKQIAAIDTLIKESGLFRESFSFLSLPLLKKEGSNLYPYTLGERPPYESSANTKEAGEYLTLYPADFALYIDKERRFVLFRVLCADGEGCGEAMSDERRQEWKDRLDRINIPNWFFDEEGFRENHDPRFYTYLGAIRIEGVEEGQLSGGEFWENLYRLQRDLYSIKGVKQLYTPWHVFNTLAALLGEKLESQGSRLRVLQVWELAASFRSARLNIEGGVVFIFYYGTPGAPEIDAKVAQTMGGQSALGEFAWTIRLASGETIRKET